MISRPYKYAYAYPTEAERLQKKQQHDIALKKLQTMTPRKVGAEGKPEGKPPFGLGILAGLGQGPSRPYKGQRTDSPEKKKEKKDKEKGRGKLVSQVTPGKLRKEPDIIASLLQQIFDFFKNISNPPTPIKNVMEKYPAPPYTTPTVPPRITTS
jgi:hypothetical protein